VSYSTEGLDSDRRGIDINEDFSFFNPKVGFDFMPNNNSRFYSSIAIGNREPSRSNFLDSDYLVSDSSSHIVPEKLTDIEIGFSYTKTNFAFEIGAYHMAYDNQLVNTGMLNDVGGIIHMNVDESYRQGIELQAGFNLGKSISWQGNTTLSNNKIVNFAQAETGFETDIAFSPSLIGASILTIDLWDGGQLLSDENLDLDIEFATKYVGKQYLDNTSSDDRALPSYIVNDVVLRCDFVVNEKNVNISLFANNILNHMYSASGWTYYYPDGEGGEVSENYVYPQAGRNGFASMSVKF
jgi:iron complex outermembrane receptor protein